MQNETDASPAPPREEVESKFPLDNAAAAALERGLRAWCVPDPEFSGAIVSSIYFDTRDWRLLGEKIASDDRKTKVRLRWYGDLETGAPGEVSFLEWKSRHGGARTKRRERTDLTGAWLEGVPLEDLSLVGLPRRLGPELPVMGLLQPAFVVRYRRTRFLEPRSGARIALDRDICVPRVNRRMLPYPSRRPIARAVLEVKGVGKDLPEVLRPLARRGLRRESFSKYLAGYREVLRIRRV